MAWSAHRDRKRRAIHADLERLLHRDEVLGAVALDACVRRAWSAGSSDSACEDRRDGSRRWIAQAGEVADALELGVAQAVRHRRAAPEQLLRGVPRRVGEPRPGRVRDADPPGRRLRRLRARHEGARGLDPRRHPSLQHPPAAAPPEHDGAARRFGARRRLGARADARRRAAPPGPHPAPARFAGPASGLRAHRVGRGARPGGGADPRARPGADRLLPHLAAGCRTSRTTRRRRPRVRSARTRSTTRRASATRPRPSA